MNKNERSKKAATKKSTREMTINAYSQFSEEVMKNLTTQREKSIQRQL
jgi:hypothetical protein